MLCWYLHNTIACFIICSEYFMLILVFSNFSLLAGLNHPTLVNRWLRLLSLASCFAGLNYPVLLNFWLRVLNWAMLRNLRKPPLTQRVYIELSFCFSPARWSIVCSFMSFNVEFCKIPLLGMETNFHCIYFSKEKRHCSFKIISMNFLMSNCMLCCHILCSQLECGI